MKQCTQHNGNKTNTKNAVGLCKVWKPWKFFSCIHELLQLTSWNSRNSHWRDKETWEIPGLKTTQSTPKGLHEGWRKLTSQTSSTQKHRLKNAEINILKLFLFSSVCVCVRACACVRACVRACVCSKCTTINYLSIPVHLDMLRPPSWVFLESFPLSMGSNAV